MEKKSESEKIHVYDLMGYHVVTVCSTPARSLVAVLPDAILHPPARNSSSCSRVPTCAIFIMIWTTNAKYHGQYIAGCRSNWHKKYSHANGFF